MIFGIFLERYEIHANNFRAQKLFESISDTQQERSASTETISCRTGQGLHYKAGKENIFHQLFSKLFVSSFAIVAKRCHDRPKRSSRAIFGQCSLQINKDRWSSSVTVQLDLIR